MAIVVFFPSKNKRLTTLLESLERPLYSSGLIQQPSPFFKALSVYRHRSRKTPAYVPLGIQKDSQLVLAKRLETCQGSVYHYSFHVFY